MAKKQPRMDAVAARSALFLSELGHIEQAERFMAERQDIRRKESLLVALGLQVEWELTRRNIPFISGRGFRIASSEPLVLAEGWALKVLEHPQWSFFSYRGVSFARVYFFSLQTHLTSVLYYTGMLANICKAYPSLEHLVAFRQSSNAPVRGSSLPEQDENVLVPAVAAVATSLGKELEIVGGQRHAPTIGHASFFWLKRALFSIALALLNTFIRLACPRKKVRVLIYDYWRNITPLLIHLPSTELLMLERLEALSAGFKNIVGFRMRFLDFNSCIFRAAAARQKTSMFFAGRWGELKHSFDFSFAHFCGISHADILREALGVYVEDTLNNSLAGIDAAHTLLERTKPEVVLLRVSTSSIQPRFPIVAMVARERGIPAFELQHGLDYNGPGTPSRFHNAQYLGVYGALSATEITDTYTTPVLTGSPRFDAYVPAPHTAKKTDGSVSMTVIAPSPCIGITLDTYDVEEYFTAVATAVKKIGSVEVHIKLRPGGGGHELYRPLIATAFADVPHEIVSDEPLLTLFGRSDLVVSCFSTAAIEALVCGVPLINLALSPGEKMMGEYHFACYAAAGAMKIAHTQKSFEEALAELASKPEKRAALRERAAAFIKKHYLFDGHSGERAAALLERLAIDKKV